MLDVYKQLSVDGGLPLAPREDAHRVTALQRVADQMGTHPTEESPWRAFANAARLRSAANRDTVSLGKTNPAIRLAQRGAPRHYTFAALPSSLTYMRADLTAAALRLDHGGGALEDWSVAVA